MKRERGKAHNRNPAVKGKQNCQDRNTFQMLKPFFRALSRIVFQSCCFKLQKDIAGSARDKKILELASGKPHKGECYFSLKDLLRPAMSLSNQIKEESGLR